MADFPDWFKTALQTRFLYVVSVDTTHVECVVSIERRHA